MGGGEKRKSTEGAYSKKFLNNKIQDVRVRQGMWNSTHVAQPRGVPPCIPGNSIMTDRLRATQSNLKTLC